MYIGFRHFSVALLVAFCYSFGFWVVEVTSAFKVGPQPIVSQTCPTTE